ncbi:MAG: hypothetical protein HPZ91_15270 [Lentisphaeria bacterium]|nr:hypothetical protein [Lentisphaeria bacterium]
MTRTGKSRIALVLPWYGKWPVYFPFFLESCRRNPGLDVLLVTDLPEVRNLPPNVKHHHLPFEELRRRIDGRLGVTSSVPGTGKLRDFRPMYGILFCELLGGYSHWAWGDCDLIYGAFDRWLDSIGFGRYDVAGIDRLWLSGSFCAFRNVEKVNRLFERSPDWRLIASIPEYRNFDECGGHWRKLMAGAEPGELPGPVSMTRVCREAEEAGELRVFRGDVVWEGLKPRQLIEYRDGILRSRGEELPVFHFLWVKSRSFFFFPGWKRIPRHYRFDDTGFYGPFSIGFRVPLRAARKLRGAAVSLRRHGLKNLGRRLRNLSENG